MGFHTKVRVSLELPELFDFLKNWPGWQRLAKTLTLFLPKRFPPG